MKVILVLIVILPSLYTFSFAKYNWNRNNKPAAVGSILIALISVVLPITLLYVRS